MQRFRLAEVTSAHGDDTWVSLGFESTLAPFDVLHVVPGSAPDASDGLYVERFDQAYSTANGVRSLVVERDHVTIPLTDDAQRELAFDSAELVFEGADRLAAYREAIHAFREMTRRGYPIQIAQDL
jgi:hypothetical protein